MQREEFNYKGKKISYRTKGAGPLIVLLHGFGEDGNVWKAQFDLFPDHLLVVPDLPGSGESEMVEDMSMEGLADVIKALMEAPPPPKGGSAKTQSQLMQETISDTASSQSEVSAFDNPSSGGGGAVLIGHSMGGYVTLAFAEKYPEVLKAFGLFHSTAFADSEEKKETRRKGIKFIQQHGSYEFLKTSTPNLYEHSTKEHKSHLINEQIEAVRNADGAALIAYYESMIRRPDRTAVLKNSRVPVLFVLGKYDNAVPLQDGLKQCHLPQLSYIELLQNSGHMGMVEEIDKSNKILTEFIATL